MGNVALFLVAKPVLSRQVCNPGQPALREASTWSVPVKGPVRPSHTVSSRGVFSAVPAATATSGSYDTGSPRPRIVSSDAKPGNDGASAPAATRPGVGGPMAAAGSGSATATAAPADSKAA